MSVSVVAGLGNPGPAYEGTRHNAGFLLVDALAAEWGCDWAKDRKARALFAVADRGGRRILLVKPQTYVNKSGSCLNAFCGYYKLPVSSVAVVYDEINLPIGRAKVSVGGSAGGHNGIADILRCLGDDFIRFRVGIGPKDPPQIDMKDFVLGKLKPEEIDILNRAKKGFLDGLKLLIDSGPQTAMNRVNQRSRPPGGPSEETSTHRAEETDNEHNGKKKIPGHGDPGPAGT